MIVVTIHGLQNNIYVLVTLKVTLHGIREVGRPVLAIKAQACSPGSFLGWIGLGACSRSAEIAVEDIKLRVRPG